MKYIKQLATLALSATMLLVSSCTGDLDVTPISPKMDSNLDPVGLFNKCYANFALGGNQQTDGDCDLDGADGGQSGFCRQYFNSNELTTDEAICHWSDNGLRQYCYNEWNANHPMLHYYFSRLTIGILYCNQYLATCSNVDATKTAEVRLLRAMQYYFLMDAFGNVPFSTTADMKKPVRKTRAEMYEWLETEILDLEKNLSEPKAKTSSDAGYYRADKAAAWMLLCRLYLNAEVYTGKPQWEKAAEYAKKVIDSDYQLNTTGSGKWSAYQMLFMGDNGETSAAREGIFRIGQDGTTTKSYTGTTYFMGAGYDAKMRGDFSGTFPNATNNTSSNWGGNRCRKDLILKFFPSEAAVPQVPCLEMPAKAGDDRCLFDGTKGVRTLDNGDGCDGKFVQGYATCKWNNFNTKNSAGHDSKIGDTDFFLFRKAEAYLTYAEATARLNGGKTTAEGTEAVNTLRRRAHAEEKSVYTLDDLCDEWAREFYYEGLRRPTLIRFGRFGGNNNYNWSYKGGVKAGTNFDAHLNIFAIPAEAVNNTIIQNPGY
ncbi:MAG: RagB/SusD family nutrient uptake outer membrane protein [Prevotella sp.]